MDIFLTTHRYNSYILSFKANKNGNEKRKNYQIKRFSSVNGLQMGSGFKLMESHKDE